MQRASQPQLWWVACRRHFAYWLLHSFRSLRHVACALRNKNYLALNIRLNFNLSGNWRALAKLQAAPFKLKQAALISRRRSPMTQARTSTLSRSNLNLLAQFIWSANLDALELCKLRLASCTLQVPSDSLAPNKSLNENTFAGGEFIRWLACGQSECK